MSQTIEQIRDRTLAKAMRQLDETHAVLRVTACWSSAERDLGLIGIDTFEPHVDLSAHVTVRISMWRRRMASSGSMWTSTVASRACGL